MNLRAPARACAFVPKPGTTALPTLKVQEETLRLFAVLMFPQRFGRGCNAASHKSGKLDSVF
jgi:hypothetical protein